MADMITAGQAAALDVPALEVRGVRKTFEAENAPVRALRGVGSSPTTPTAAPAARC